MKNQPALKSALILAMGIYIAHWWKIPIAIIYGLCFLFTLLGLLIFHRGKNNNVAQGFLLFALLFLGMFRLYQVCCFFSPNNVVHHIQSGQPAAIQGTLIKDPVLKETRFDLLLEIKKLKYNDTSLNVNGKILASIYTDLPVPLFYGDVIALHGTILKPRGRRNPGGFDYKAYLAQRNIHALCKCTDISSFEIIERKKANPFLRKIIYPSRRFIIRTINKSTTGRNQAILQALLAGEKSSISPEVRDDFARTGVIHLLAVSGLHVGFVLLFFMTLFSMIRVHYPIRVILSIVGLIVYALLTEGKAPVVRAVIMTSMYLLGTLSERRTNPLNLLGFAALLILFLNPQALFDIGFQLSFTAVLSILYFYNKFNTLSFITHFYQQNANKPFYKYIMTIMLISLSAQIGTIPLTVFTFNRLPLLSLFLNTIAIPLVGLVIALGFTTVLTSIISTWIGQIYGMLNHELLTIFIKIIHWAGNVRFSSVYLPTPNIFHVITYFSFILLLFHLRDRKLRKRFSIILLISLNCIIWKNAVGNHYNTVTWTQFDVGQGDAALLELPKGKHILIDGGDKTPNFDNGESVLAPYLRRKGIFTLDAVILSHPHNDHVGGLPYILHHFNVKEVITSSLHFASPLNREFSETIQKKHVPSRIITALDTLTSCPGVQIVFLSPYRKLFNTKMEGETNVNNQSLIVKILFGKTRLLFMGDAEREAEQEILQSHIAVNSNGIKVGHHGSNTSSSESFIEQVSPEVAVISVGENNRHHHPSEAVLQRLERFGIHTYRTDLKGAVIFRSNGEVLKNIPWK
jgi:competence protein ComEC